MKILITQKDVGREIDLDQIFRSITTVHTEPTIQESPKPKQVIAQPVANKVVKKKHGGWPKGKPRKPAQLNGQNKVNQSQVKIEEPESRIILTS